MAGPYDSKIIANEFIRKNGGPLPQMKLQKLVYISHGWNLAVNRTPLVSDKIEAWDGGPVMRSIWNHLRDSGFNAVSYLLGNPFDKAPYTDNLNPNETAIIDHVWRKYGSFSGVELSEMTHQAGTPWSNAYFGSGRNSTLSNTDIQQHFIELALAGREKAT